MATLWECKCGHLTHESMMPEDCPKCLAVGKFERVPDDMLEEKMAEEVLSSQAEEEEYEDRKSVV